MALRSPPMANHREADASRSPGTDASRSRESNPSPPLEISCRGPLRFDVPQETAALEDDVQVLRLVPGAAPDKLSSCDRLVLEFALRRDGTQPAGDGSAAASGEELAGRLEHIVALGNPCVLEAPSSGIQATAAPHGILAQQAPHYAPAER